MMDCGAACLQSISKYYGKYFLFRTQVNNIILTLFLFWPYSPSVKGWQTMSGCVPRRSASQNLTSTVFFSPGMSAK